MGNDPRGVKAKVVDFGLSVKLGDQASHASLGFQGTVTHSAPEVLLEGKSSKLSDVYAYGVTLWELAAGEAPFQGLTHMAICHRTVYRGERPAWPEGLPDEFRQLVSRCWAQDLASRPSFEVILSELHEMRRGAGECKPFQFKNISGTTRSNSFND